MKLLLVFAACALWAQTPAKTGTAAKVEPAPPKGPQPESLNYNVNWPSGLSLGEAKLNAVKGAESWKFSFEVQASLPGFALTESVESTANPDYCSLEIVKKGKRGSRKLEEKTTFDQKALNAKRKTGESGGESEFSIPSCAKDALTFLYYVRRELANGRLPVPQTVFYGAGYSLKVDYTGVQKIRIGSELLEADRMTGAIKGPASDATFEIFFAKDTARTPLLVRVPLAAGQFSMELVR